MKRKIFIVFIGVFISFFSLTGWGIADVYYVTDAAEFQAALDAAAASPEDDTINMAVGTYTENFVYQPADDFDAGSLTIIGAGADSTIIDGNNTGRGLSILIASGTPDVYIEGIKFQNGKIDDEGGGGLYIKFGNNDDSVVTNGTITIKDNTFTGNQGGVAAYIIGDGEITYQGNTFTGNQGGYAGGAAAWVGDGEITYQDNTFTNNGGGIVGGAVADVGDGDIILTNNVFTNNQAVGGGGGVYLDTDGGNYYVINNTFYNNYSGGNGGGARFWVDRTNETAYIYNNIFWQNSADGGGDDIYFGTDEDGGNNSKRNGANPVVNLFNNDFHEIAVDVGVVITLNEGNNLDVDPLFVDQANNDLHLKDRSPVIDKGNNNAPNLPLTDKDGNPRIADGDGDGNAIVDMGAYELPSLPIMPNYSELQGLYFGKGVLSKSKIGKIGDKDIYVYMQYLKNGGMILIYTYDTENMAAFYQADITEWIFNGKPIDPNLKEEVNFNFQTDELTILRESQEAIKYKLTKLEDVTPRLIDGIYKGVDTSLNLNIYVQSYRNGGTILIYTFDTETMVSLWDSKVEGKIFEGTVINPNILEVANFDFNTNILTIYHTDTGVSESYNCMIFEKAAQ